MYLVPFQFSGYSSLQFHQSLLQDSIRTDSFRKAILQEVKKNDKVLDLGSGTGVLSFFAHQAGAQKERNGFGRNGGRQSGGRDDP